MKINRNVWGRMMLVVFSLALVFPALSSRAEVRYVETVPNERSYYIVYAAPAKSEAFTFLRSSPVKDPLTYVVVETPQGNFARDCRSIFDESNGRTIEAGTRPTLSVPKKSSTHCYTCGCWIFPMEKIEMAGVSSVHRLLTIGELKEKPCGFKCSSCGNVLQCGYCLEKENSFDAEGKLSASCPVCSKPMDYYEMDGSAILPFVYRYLDQNRTAINRKTRAEFEASTMNEGGD